MIWRVDTRQEFVRLRRGPRRRAGALSVTMGPRNPTQPARVAYAIGRKVGTAPRRNLVRRRLRAVFAEQAPTLAGASYLVVVRPEAAELSYQELRADLLDALVAHGALDSPALQAPHRSMGEPAHG